MLSLGDIKYVRVTVIALFGKAYCHHVAFHSQATISLRPNCFLTQKLMRFRARYQCQQTRQLVCLLYISCSSWSSEKIVIWTLVTLTIKVVRLVIMFTHVFTAINWAIICNNIHNVSWLKGFYHHYFQRFMKRSCCTLTVA